MNSKTLFGLLVAAGVLMFPSSALAQSCVDCVDSRCQSCYIWISYGPGEDILSFGSGGGCQYAGCSGFCNDNYACYCAAPCDEALDLDSVEQLLQAHDVQELASFIQQHPTELQLTASRSALVVRTSCDGAVAAMFPLSSEQLRAVDVALAEGAEDLLRP